MFAALLAVSSVTTLGLWAASAGAAVLHHPTRDNTPFDGQYIHPNSSVDSAEWWYFQAVAEPVGDEPPVNIQVTYYQGYPFASGPPTSGEPEFYISIQGALPNGTTYSYVLPADTGDVTTSGQAVSGNWSNAGTFKIPANLSSVKASFSGSGISGSLSFTSDAAHHFGCNTTDTPFFTSALPQGASLNAAETIVYKELGWATTIPGGKAVVNLVVEGNSFSFTGDAYHDANFIPAPLNDFVSSWYFLYANVGPYLLSAVLLTPTNATRELNTGYLAVDGIVLQNQCSVVGSRTTDFGTATPYGLQHDSVTDQDLPTGFLLNYTLSDGDLFTFNLTSLVINPDQNIYHRFVGTATGGKAGEQQQSGTALFEWVNPGLNVYTPPQ